MEISWGLIKYLVRFWAYFGACYSIRAIFHSFKWPSIGKITSPSGHTALSLCLCLSIYLTLPLSSIFFTNLFSVFSFLSPSSKLWCTFLRDLIFDLLKKIQLLLPASVTRLGDFWKFLVTNYLLNVAQMFCDFLGILKI